MGLYSNEGENKILAPTWEEVKKCREAVHELRMIAENPKDVDDSNIPALKNR